MQKMKSVFIVHHSYQLDDDAFSEETKLIGVYSSKKEAEEAVVRSRKLPDFDRLPDYFSIDEYELDKDHWTEGFDTKRYQPLFSVWKKDSGGNIELIKEGLVEADALRLVS